MTTDDLRTRAREAAERIYPREHVGYKKPPPEGCGCNECYVSESQRLACIAGYLAHAAQRPTRGQLRTEFLYRMRTVAAHYRMAGRHGEQVEAGWIEAEADKAVLALLDGAGS